MWRGCPNAAFEIHGGVAKRGTGLGTRRANGWKQVLRALDRPHAFAAAPGHRLHEERIPHLRRRGRDLIIAGAGVEGLLGSRDDWHPRPDRGLPRGGLAAHQPDRLGRGSDERQSCVRAGLGEPRILGQEAVAGMDGVGTRTPCGVDDAVDAKVTFRGGARADVNGLVRFTDMPSVAVAVGVDRHARNGHLAAGPNDPDGDLAAVGDEDFGMSQSPYSNAASARAYGTCGSRRSDVPTCHVRRPA